MKAMLPPDNKYFGVYFVNKPQNVKLNYTVSVRGSLSWTVGPMSTRRLLDHTQEVCEIHWSTNHQQLVSGGNDNIVMVYCYCSYGVPNVCSFSSKRKNYSNN
uniref:Uncharacterized protein n=1 Tax=Amphimedon queenslandica TaxID=400682 RepID=A0A1X7UZ93_AMPQE